MIPLSVSHLEFVEGNLLFRPLWDYFFIWWVTWESADQGYFLQGDLLLLRRRVSCSDSLVGDLTVQVVPTKCRCAFKGVGRRF